MGEACAGSAHGCPERMTCPRRGMLSWERIARMNPVTSPATLITLCRCARDKQGSVCLEKGGHVLGHLGGRASPDFLEVKLRPHRGALSPPPPPPPSPAHAAGGGQGAARAPAYLFL